MSPSSPELHGGMKDKPFVDKWGFVHETPFFVPEVFHFFFLSFSFFPLPFSDPYSKDDCPATTRGGGY